MPGAILITTNKSVRDWTELLAGDEVLAAAILDRLLHRAHVLNIKGRSYRLRDLEDALKLSHACSPPREPVGADADHKSLRPDRPHRRPSQKWLSPYLVHLGVA